MSPVARLTRLLLSLPELGLRVQWLQDKLRTWPLETSTRRLNELAEASERSEADARHALVVVAAWLASVGDCTLRAALKGQAEASGAHNLERMLRSEGGSGEHAVEGEGRVPDYGTGRELSLGERRSLARRPPRELIEKLTLDPHPLVIAQLLGFPQLTLDDVLRIASARPARAPALAELCKSFQWVARPRVRIALALNPYTPANIAMPFLPILNRSELGEVVATTTLSPVRRATALELLGKRPPLRRNSESPSLQ